MIGDKKTNIEFVKGTIIASYLFNEKNLNRFLIRNNFFV
jgi:hypothetical protein